MSMCNLYLRNVSFILILVQNLSHLHEAAESADLPNLILILWAWQGRGQNYSGLHNRVLLTGIGVHDVCQPRPLWE